MGWLGNEAFDLQFSQLLSTLFSQEPSQRQEEERQRRKSVVGWENSQGQAWKWWHSQIFCEMERIRRPYLGANWMHLWQPRIEWVVPHAHCNLCPRIVLTTIACLKSGRSRTSCWEADGCKEEEESGACWWEGEEKGTLKMHTFPCRVLFSGARTHFFSCAFATTEAKNCQLGREQQVSWNLQLISSLNVLRQLNFYSSRRHLLHLLAPFPHRKACRWEEFGWRRIRISEWSNESWGCVFTESLLTAVPPFTHFHTRCKENTSWVEHWFWALHPVEVKLTFSSSPANRLFLYSSIRCAEFVWRRTVSWVCATNTRQKIFLWLTFSILHACAFSLHWSLSSSTQSGCVCLWCVFWGTPSTGDLVHCVAGESEKRWGWGRGRMKGERAARQEAW